MSEVRPIIEFDETRAMRYSSVYNLEFVRIVEKPAHEETEVTTRFTGSETFVGSYVEVVDQELEDAVLYAYSYDRFHEAHIPPEDIEDEPEGSDRHDAYPAPPVDAYQADIEGQLLTDRLSGPRGVRVGDWIVRTAEGVWCISNEVFTVFYNLDSARPIPAEEPE